VACLALVQAGCADILPWPGFESHPGIFSYTEQLPAAEVAEQVRCELAEFLREEERAHETDRKEGPFFLDPNKGAQIQLKLTTDLQGSVSYLGINLKGLGLNEIAALVTPANNNPSLQLKAQGKSTQISQADFIIPQTTDNTVWAVKGEKVLSRTLPRKLMLPDEAECSHGDAKRFLEYVWFRLWLSDALKRYKERLGAQGYGPGETFADRVCQPKLTITTQFQLLFDVSAGTNILQAVPIILPISGLNIDASPDYTHSIQIIFALRPRGKYKANGIEPISHTETQERIDACQALQSSNPPAAVR
jgi:hypothetical protein